MTAHHSHHHGMERSNLGKIARGARAHLHWVAILLWAVAFMAAVAPLL